MQRGGWLVLERSAAALSFEWQWPSLPARLRVASRAGWARSSIDPQACECDACHMAYGVDCNMIPRALHYSGYMPAFAGYPFTLEEYPMESPNRAPQTVTLDDELMLGELDDYLTARDGHNGSEAAEVIGGLYARMIYTDRGPLPTREEIDLALSDHARGLEWSPARLTWQLDRNCTMRTGRL